MSNNKYLEFSERLNNLIKRNNTSLREISDHTKINYEMVRRYANGLAKPREEKMQLLASFLKTSVAYLDYGEGDMPDRNGNSIQSISLDPSLTGSPSTIDLISNLKEMEANQELTPQLVSVINGLLETVKSASASKKETLQKAPTQQIDVNKLMEEADKEND